MSDFDAAFREFLAEYFAQNPVLATATGEHRHDGAWPDATEAGRRARLEAGDRWLARFGSLTGLTPDEAIDRDLVVGELEAARFAETELREDAWNPLEWVYLLGEGIFTLIAREFAPLADRLTSVASRLEGIPLVLDGAREALVGVEGRPVGRFQTEAALRQLPGITELIDDAVAEADGAASDAAVVALTPRLREAAATAKAALGAFETHLRDVVLPASEGDGLLGRDLFARKMRHTMRSDELTAERILAAAEREYPRSVPRWSGWPATCGRRGAATGRSPMTTARSSAGSSTRSPPSTPRPTTSSTGAARRPRGSRRSAPSTMSSASPTSRW